MISGRNSRRTAIVPISDELPNRGRFSMEATVDTGYSGYLTISLGVATDMQLLVGGSPKGVLADGTIIELDLYLINIYWNGQLVEVSASQLDGPSLIGMALLENSRLTIDIREGGEVKIEALL